MAGTSYKDPGVLVLASNVEQKLGLPDGLLANIVTKGERSNSDQVSEAGARGLGQIIPATRKAAIEKFGIDPYLSDENSLEVAGHLLKDSLDRNKGNVAAAVGEYHGGTDRANWGNRTRTYIQRVVGTQPEKTESAPATAPIQSTYERVKAQQPPIQPTGSAIAAVYNAYKSGRMTPEEAKQFEGDVNGGLVMLPRGAALNGATPQGAKPAPTMLPQAVTDAYVGGKMTDKEKADLEADISSGLVTLPASAQSKIPTGPDFVQPTTQGVLPKAPPPPSIMDTAIGSGEAILNAVTGMTGGMAGMVYGAGKGVVQSVQDGTFGTDAGVRTAEKSAADAANALTYQPRTESGQEQAQAVGEGMQNLIPIAAVAHTLPPLMSGAKGTPASVMARAGTEGAARDVVNVVAKPAEAAGLVAPGYAGEVAAGAVAAGTDAAVTGAGKVAAMAKEATTLPRRALERLTADGAGENKPTAGTRSSGGSAGTDMAGQRKATADQLPVPMGDLLTKGDLTRDPAQQKFEVETAKLPDEGKPLRDRIVAKNQAILDNFDAAIDQTGAEAPTLRAVGQAVDKALVDKARRAKTEIRARYKAAENAGEMEAPVVLQGVIDHLNDAAPEAATAPLITTARALAIKLGIAKEEGGILVPASKGTVTDALMNQVATNPGVSLRRAELFRQAINRATDFEATNIRQSTIIKGLVDQATDGMGGDLYKAARAARSRYAQEFENHAVIAKLLNNKRGSADRQVAMEDVFHHSILKGSLDDVRTVRKVLQTAGPDGMQAWKELQGATLRDVRDNATKSVALDSTGNRVMSPAALDKAITALDADGKLDFIFGKKGAQTLRDIREIAQISRTVSPEAAINHSNTAMTLAALADTVFSGLSGIPAPIATTSRMALKHIKDVRLRNRISDALNEMPKKAPGRRSPHPIQAPSRTVH
jgi:hypothetical protein